MVKYMSIILSYLRDYSKYIIRYIVFFIIFCIIFFLYNMPLEAVLYGFTLCSVIGMIYVFIDILNYKKKHNILKRIEKSIIYTTENLPRSRGLIEEDYKNLINILFEENNRLLSKADNDLRNMDEYYTMWAHQIKTPISAMKILLQSQAMNSEGIKIRRDEDNLYLLNELFKIEQYVEMVLGYLRMESISSDLSLEKYSLDDIVRQVIRKYAKLFVNKKISLRFNELNKDVLTDEKWLSFVIEQIISNAIKYTNIGGQILIYMDKLEPKTLIIEDNGIGIEAEDLPRVFERGFTGFNGRTYKKSTGIGLYLCKNILKRLSHTIEIESEVSKFTRVKINLETIDLTKV